MSDTKVFLPHVKLRFNIEHPTVEEAYAFGYECALADVSEEENPFASGTIECDQWYDGWWDAFYGERPLFAEAITEIADIPANDQVYKDKTNIITKFLEISGVIVISALIGYQLFELVA